MHPLRGDRYLPAKKFRGVTHHKPNTTIHGYLTHTHHIETLPPELGNHLPLQIKHSTHTYTDRKTQIGEKELHPTLADAGTEKPDAG